MDWDCPVITYQLQDQLLFTTCPDAALSPSRSIREVRQRMSTVTDSSLNNVTNLRDVIDVPVPDIVSTCAVTFK